MIKGVKVFFFSLKFLALEVCVCAGMCGQFCVCGSPCVCEIARMCSCMQRKGQLEERGFN